jgi:hypothetical protein
MRGKYFLELSSEVAFLLFFLFFDLLFLYFPPNIFSLALERNKNKKKNKTHCVEFKSARFTNSTKRIENSNGNKKNQSQ